MTGKKSISHQNIEPKQGDLVKFYDCQKAANDRDYSGANPKHYPIGKVLRVYDHAWSLEENVFVDRVCDVEIDGRISKGHFVTGVEIQ